MKKVSMVARIIVYMLGLAALAVCGILLPELAREEAVGKPINPYVTYGFLLGAYVVASPFFIALYHTLKLLSYIDKNKAFSLQSITALRNIKRCAIAFAGLVIIATISGISIARAADPREDVTFMITFCAIFVFISGLLAIFVAVLQKLLADAVALKSENDLII